MIKQYFMDNAYDFARGTPYDFTPGPRLLDPSLSLPLHGNLHIATFVMVY